MSIRRLIDPARIRAQNTHTPDRSEGSSTRGQSSDPTVERRMLGAARMSSPPSR